VSIIAHAALKQKICPTGSLIDIGAERGRDLADDRREHVVVDLYHTFRTP